MGMADVILKHVEALFQREGLERHGVDVRIHERQIAEIGDNLESPPGARVIDCSGMVAIPGLVNAHHHFFQILTRCLPAAQDAKLFDWLNYHYGVWRHVDAEMVDSASRLAMAELLLTGCTTTSDHHYLFPRGVEEDLIGLQVKAAEDLGIRFCGTRGSMTLGKSKGGLPPEELVEDDERVLFQSEDAIRKYHDPQPFSMRQIHLAPCSPFNVTAEVLKQSATLARKHGVRLHTHLAETQDEVEYCQAHYGKRPLEWMEGLGWLGDDVWFAHGIHFNDAEISRLATTQSGVAHCPSSNMRLGSGAARIPELMKQGVPVGLAVDGSASNDSSDMLGEVRQAMLLGRSAWGSAALSARQAISLATAGSARLLGRSEIGTLEVGQAADIAIFDLDKLAYAGAADPIAALVFCGTDHRAHTVIVNGEIVVESGHLVRVEEERVKRRGSTAAHRLLKNAGM
jgi:8-oxoguanine deaminase